MPTWGESKNFFPHEDDPSIGDIVVRVVDPRQAYYKSIPVKADDEVEDHQWAEHFAAK